MRDPWNEKRVRGVQHQIGADAASLRRLKCGEEKVYCRDCVDAAIVHKAEFSHGDATYSASSTNRINAYLIPDPLVIEKGFRCRPF